MLRVLTRRYKFTNAIVLKKYNQLRKILDKCREINYNNIIFLCLPSLLIQISAQFHVVSPMMSMCNCSTVHKNSLVIK